MSTAIVWAYSVSFAVRLDALAGHLPARDPVKCDGHDPAESVRGASARPSDTAHVPCTKSTHPKVPSPTLPSVRYDEMSRHPSLRLRIAAGGDVAAAGSVVHPGTSLGTEGPPVSC